MGNNGHITVFLSLMITALLLLSLTAIEIVGVYMDRAKAAEASKGAVENIKAHYNPYLFENYHLLLLDTNDMEEGNIEETTKEYLEYTLANGGLDVNDVILSNSNTIIDNDYQDMKNQICEYMKLYEEITSISKIADKLISDDSTLEQLEEEIEQGKEEKSDEESDWDGDDPRDTLKKATKNGLITLVLPKNTTLSDEKIDRTSLSSDGKYSSSTEEEINTSFDDIDQLQSELNDQNSGTTSSIGENIYGIMYGLECFDYLTSKKEYGHKQKCEVEYIICGKDSDYENVSSIANKIMLHRLPFNMSCLITDKKRLAEVESIALTLSLAPGITYGAAKYLLIGAWSYAETVVEIKALFSGDSIEYIKTSDNWITDINNLGDIKKETEEAYEGEDGIDYKDYLTLLLAENTADMYYRMGDIIELNVRETNNDFYLSKCIDSFSLDINISGEAVFPYFSQTYSSDGGLYDYSLTVAGSLCN